jgi:hypothetical protein
VAGGVNRVAVADNPVGATGSAHAASPNRSKINGPVRV